EDTRLLDAIWPAVRQITNAIRRRELDMEQVQALVGEAEAIRVIIGHEERISERPGVLLKQDDGLGVLVSREDDFEDCEDAQVRLEVVKKEGVFLLRGRWVRTGPLPDILPSSVRGALEKLTVPPLEMVVIEPASDFEFARNRRRAFRLNDGRMTRARRLVHVPNKGWVGHGQPFRCRVENLSFSGCALVLPGTLASGNRIQVDLILQDGRMLVSAEVVHVRAPTEDGLVGDQEPGPPVHGMRFVGLKEAERERLQQEVLRRQAEYRQIERLRGIEALQARKEKEAQPEEG
ncbi:MAG: PilZ domain-containing protein, partial [Myxococcota bacterium]|nr:PilZ domain-containing protein [Myxococcota bacterium]